jgi:hypothetical protein
MGGGGGRGAKSYDREKVWPSIRHSILSVFINVYAGGLGATFYVSYFNTALIFILILLLVVEVSRSPTHVPKVETNKIFAKICF